MGFKETSDSEIPSQTLRLLTYSGIKKVPLIMQSEVAECGLTSLAMISSYYGGFLSLSQLRESVTLDLQGINLKQLMDIANECNLSSRAVQCELHEINQLKLPCILHWNLNHFVVLTRVSKKWIYINDPAIGKRKLTVNEFSDSYTGIALELNPTINFKKNKVKRTMKANQLWEKIIGLKRSLISLFLLSVVMQSIALISPYYIQWVVDTVLLSNDEALLLILAIGFTLLTLIQIAVSSFRGYLIIRLSSAMNIQMGANLFHHLIRLPMGYFEKRHIGDIVSRFGSMTSVRELLTTGVIEALIDGIMAIIILIMMYLYSPLLATLVVFIVIISFIVRLAFYYPNRAMTEKTIIASAKEDSSFLESIRSIQTIKLFSHEANRQNFWLNQFAEVINAGIHLDKLNIGEDAFNSLIFGLEKILIIYFGALIVIDGNLTIGMLLAFIAYKEQFTSSMIALMNKVISFKLLGLYLERLSDITLQQQEFSQSEATLPSPIQGYLQIKNISFRYSDNSKWILKDISFEVQPNESIALVGTSGCGKTTLIKIILGLLKPCEGKIYLDGVDINKLPLNKYRKYLGAVMQNDTLFSGTLSENLTMFDTNYNKEKLIECCKCACIFEDIQDLPMGFQSLVGDMGSVFSGGQLQRIFLARALYKEPKILCLDESTSHLDQENEHAINNNVAKINMTKIVIAHRKETIESVDRVIYLDSLIK